MKKLIMLLAMLMLCTLATTCSAFELDSSRWVNLANVNNIEVYYDTVNIVRNGDTAKVWLCYHYKENDGYRLQCKEYTKGSNRTVILKTLDYYSDGTFKKGNGHVIKNVAMGVNEGNILSKLW